MVRQRLQSFYTHLKMEENLQKLYQSKQAILEADNMMGNHPHHNDEFDHNMMDEANINYPDQHMDHNQFATAASNMN